MKTTKRTAAPAEDLILAGGKLSKADIAGAVSAADLTKKLVVHLTKDTDLEQYIGQTAYAKSNTNAYFGTLVQEKDGLVELHHAHDSYGETDLTLRVPKACVWAIVSHAPRMPTMEDAAGLFHG